MSLEPLHDGNQTRLGNGCVCDSGCESCDALAEAWEAMREALKHMQQVGMSIRAESVIWHDIDHAVALADKVMTRER